MQVEAPKKLTFVCRCISSTTATAAGKEGASVSARFAPTAKVRAATEERGGVEAAAVDAAAKAGRKLMYGRLDGTLCAQDPLFQPREGVSPATL